VVVAAEIPVAFARGADGRLVTATRTSDDDEDLHRFLADGTLGKGVTDVVVERAEDNDSSRIVATHDGYLRSFGLLHRRSISLGNDGKEVRGSDTLVAKGRRKVKDAVQYAVRFHLAPDVEPTLTADGMGAILRSRGAPPWNFRCRGGMLAHEESIMIDGRGASDPVADNNTTAGRAQNRRVEIYVGESTQAATPGRQVN